MTKTINLFEAFSGIGAQSQAILNLGFGIKLVGISDWYTDAIIAYGLYHLKLKSKSISRTEVIDFLKDYSLSLNSKTKAKTLRSLSDDKLSIIYQVILKFGDLDIHNLKGDYFIGKDTDLFTYSFPCQDISQQGKQRGFSRGTVSRSGLLWEIERILKEIKSLDNKSLPKILMMENVKAILNQNFAGDLQSWIEELEKLGYKSTKPFVVDATDFGEAQKRQRVFMISYLGNKPKEFDFVNKNKFKQKFIKDVFENSMPHEIFRTTKDYRVVEREQKTGIKKAFLDGYTNFNRENYVYYKDGKSPTITSSGAQSRIKVFDGDDIVYLNGFEHLKLQGFTSTKFYKNLLDIGLSDTKIKYLAGNSINIKVLEELFRFYL